MGEVLLTTRMSEVLLRFNQTVLTGYAAFRQGNAKCILVQSRQLGPLSQRKPALGIKPAG